jgi:tetratricopeptide (TPR) repeat protein
LEEADALAPLSTGVGRFAPLHINLQPEPGGAGGSVTDVSFIPLFRPDPTVTGTHPACPDWAWRRDGILAGHPQEALAGLPDYFIDVRPEHPTLPCGPAGAGSNGIGAVAQAEAEPGAASGDVTDLELLADTRQNLWRWAGDLPRAEEVVRAWLAKAGPAAFLPMARLGELDYLQHRYDDAAADFGSAARRRRDAGGPDRATNDLEADELILDRGAALFAAGRGREGETVLRGVDGNASYWVPYINPGYPDVVMRLTAVSLHARTQLADNERETGALLASAEDYAAAQERLRSLEQDRPSGFRPGAVYGNQALTQLALGRVADARTSIAQALNTDPQDPVFLMTAGFIADQAGRTQEAAGYDAAALGNDAGAFPAANDLGVELARLHSEDRAVAALRQAVGARPDYALGWFNLGVLYDRMGPAHLLTSQGALARAFAVDPALRDRERRLTIDASVYRSGLDLSKPLPPHWSLAGVDRQAPAAAAGLLAACLLGLGLARRATAGDGRDIVGKVVEPATERLGRLPVIRRLRHPGWALGATVVTFLLPELRHPGGRTTEIVTFGLGVLVIAGLVLSARSAIARRTGVAAAEATWGPGVVFGVATGAAGLPWAPLPVVSTSHAGQDAGQRVHWAAPLALAFLGIPLLFEAALLDVPLTRALAVTAVIMAASVLTPLEPLDGKRVGAVGALAGVGVVGAAALLVLGIV